MSSAASSARLWKHTAGIIFLQMPRVLLRAVIRSGSLTCCGWKNMTLAGLAATASSYTDIGRSPWSPHGSRLSSCARESFSAQKFFLARAAAASRAFLGYNNMAGFKHETKIRVVTFQFCMFWASSQSFSRPPATMASTKRSASVKRWLPRTATSAFSVTTTDSCCAAVRRSKCRHASPWPRVWSSAASTSSRLSSR
ncbi:PP163 [Orf virus]|uniref:PP163 n=1 Tax=Orf virus TaxID=10258 RepID=F1AWY9_ORFV|nr:PP163 [Orf virus]